MNSSKKHSKSENKVAAQAKLLQRAAANSKAQLGKYGEGLFELSKEHDMG